MFARRRQSIRSFLELNPSSLLPSRRGKIRNLHDDEQAKEEEEEEEEAEEEEEEEEEPSWCGI